MKNKINLNRLLLIALLAVSACEEEKVQPFSVEQGINFVATDFSKDGTDTYTLLDRSVDMVSNYTKGKFGFEYDTLKVLVRLEGRLSDKPLKVCIKATPVEGLLTPEFILSETYIKPGKVIDTISIYTKPLETLEITYQATFTFDYEKSDVVPGVKERQQFTLTVSDIFPLKKVMYASSGDDWNNRYATLLGNYGEQKVRFIWSVLKGDNFIFYRKNYYKDESYMKNKIPEFKAKLEVYNKLHKDNPLKEKDGSLVTFDLN